MAAKKWQWDKNKTREENLWDVLLAASAYYIKIKGRKFNSFPGMTFKDIEHEILVRAYPMMVKKLDEGWQEAHPDITLWNLGFTCCWNAWSNIRYTFAQKYGKQLLNTVSLDTPIHGSDCLTIADTLSATNYLTYKPSGNNGHGQRKERLVTDMDDIQDYLESCIECSLQPDADVVEEMLLRLDKLPKPEDVPGFENMVKLMRTAKYRATFNHLSKAWTDIYRKFKNEPPKEFVYLEGNGGNNKVIHREPNPAYRPCQGQPGRLPAAEGPQGIS